MELTPGIHHLKVPIPDNPLGHLNAYLVKTTEGCLLIDTGWNVDSAWEELVKQLGEAGVSFSDLRYVVITHAHPDHYGLVNRLQYHTDAPLVIHNGEMASVRARSENLAGVLEAMGGWLRLNGVPDEVRAERQRAQQALRAMVLTAMPALIVSGGEHLKLGEWDLEIVWTPGHAPGHICLYEASRRILFAGDHVLPIITPNVSLHSPAAGNPLHSYLESLQRVEGLEVDMVLPGHGEVFTGLRQRAIEIRLHHDARAQATLRAMGESAKTAWEIAPGIPWMEDERGWYKLSAVHKCMAVTETLSHLELLRSEGVVTRSQTDGLVSYAVAGRPVEGA